LQSRQSFKPVFDETGAATTLHFLLIKKIALLTLVQGLIAFAQQRQVLCTNVFLPQMAGWTPA
jgi:hypothetical protein